jgi:hypothetical protein
MSESTQPFRLRPEYLSPAETAFYHVLHELVKDHYFISPKVPLQDIFAVTRPNENVQQFSKLNRKSVDFLLLYRDTLLPAFAIELDYPQQTKAREVDEFMDGLFKTANLPFIHVTVQQIYDPQAIWRRMREAIRLAQHTDPLERPEDYSPICPRCGITMVLRFYREGPLKGKKYYGCLNFPACTAVVPVDDPTPSP